MVEQLGNIPEVMLLRAEYRYHVNKKHREIVLFPYVDSVIEEGTWLQPHYGQTNGQLKFHLGLVVPSGPAGEPCTHFRVGSLPYRSWQEGKALFFDDSFNHEVWNNCTSKRVIFQVVVVHPDLVSKRLGVNVDPHSSPTGPTASEVRKSEL